MSETFSTSSAVPFQSEIDKFTANKDECSNARYNSVLVLLVLLTVCNAAFNAAYGLSQAVTVAAAALMCTAYLLGDFIVVSLAPTALPKIIGRIFLAISLVGLICLSIFSAASFLIAQQFAKENTLIEAKKAEVAELTKGLATLDPRSRPGNYRETRKALQQAQQHLQSMVGENGPDGSSAIYHWIAKTYGYAPESVSLCVRFVWAANFVFAGIALSFFLATLYCPRTLSNHLAFLTQLEAAKNPISEEEDGTRVVEERRSSSSHPRTPRGITYDTGTAGDNAHRYQTIKADIKDGKLRPSKSALKTQGIGSDTALAYLRALESEGVIYRNGKGYARNTPTPTAT